MIIGDMTTTLCPAKDRWNYSTDNHKKCRTVINNWIDEGDFIDTYKTFNPDGKSYTYRVREAEYLHIGQGEVYTLCWAFRQRNDGATEGIAAKGPGDRVPND